MKRFSVLTLAAAALLATPIVAGPPAKRPVCQLPKAPARDSRRIEPCRKAPIPPVVDPTPMFLISTAGRAPVISDIS